MTSDDALDEREADACAREFGGIVKALEYAEKLRAEARIESGPIVADEVRVLDRIRYGAYLDHGSILLGGELDRVGNEIDQDLREQAAVAVRHREVSEPQLGLRPLMLCLQSIEVEPDELHHVNAPQLDRHAAEAREFEQIVDQRSHAGRLTADDAELA